MNQLACILALGIGCATAAAGGAKSRDVTLDVDDMPLAQVVQLLTKAGGPRLTTDADAADPRLSFAAAKLSRAASARWLCRACRLVVVKRKKQFVIGRPAIDAAELKEYRVAKVAPTQDAGEALMAFVRQVVLGAYPNRLANDDGELQPELEVTCAAGRLKVLAPPMVQREVLTLLRTIVRANKPYAFEQLRVRYQPHELGLLAPRGSAPPRLGGQVKLELEGVAAADAARALTKASKISFFIDPWDADLAKARVTLHADGLALDKAVAQIAKQLVAEHVGYDGAHMFVRAWRRPVFESLVVRAYNVSRGAIGRKIADEAARRAAKTKLPAGLPYGSAVVGEWLLGAVPAQVHKDLEGLFRLAKAAERAPVGLRGPMR